MLRCATVRRATTRSRFSQRSFDWRNELFTANISPARTLRFLPIVPGHNAATKKSRSETQSGREQSYESGIRHEPSSGATRSHHEMNGSGGNTSMLGNAILTDAQSSQPNDDVAPKIRDIPTREGMDEAFARNITFFSASLSDGTLVCGFATDQLEFEHIARMINTFWMDKSHEFVSRMPTDKLGIFFAERKDTRDCLDFVVWDIRPELQDRRSKLKASLVSSNGAPGVAMYGWQHSTKFLQKQAKWLTMKRCLIAALTNQIGAFDRNGAFNAFDTPSAHPHPLAQDWENAMGLSEFMKSSRFEKPKQLVESSRRKETDIESVSLSSDTSLVPGLLLPLKPEHSELDTGHNNHRPGSLLGINDNEHVKPVSDGLISKNYVSARLYDGTLVVSGPRLFSTLTHEESTLDFAAVLRILSQWWAQTRDNIVAPWRQRPVWLSVVRRYPGVLSVNVLEQNEKPLFWDALKYEVYFNKSNLSWDGCKPNDLSGRKTTRSQRRRFNFYRKRWREYGLKNYLGMANEAGVLEEGQRSTVRPLFKNPEDHAKKFSFAPDTGQTHSENKVDIQPKLNSSKPLVQELESEVQESRSEIQKILHDVQSVQGDDKRMHDHDNSNLPSSSEVNKYDRFARIMRLAGVLHDVKTTLDHEIADASAENNKNFVSLRALPLDITKGPNPILEAVKDETVNLEAVQAAIEGLKTQVQDREDRSRILGRVFKDWKDDLKQRYPQMSRDPVPQNNIDDLFTPRTGLLSLERLAISGTTQKKNSSGPNPFLKQLPQQDTDVQLAPGANEVLESSDLSSGFLPSSHKVRQQGIQDPPFPDTKFKSSKRLQITSRKHVQVTDESQADDNVEREMKGSPEKPFNRSHNRMNRSGGRDNDFSSFAL